MKYQSIVHEVLKRPWRPLAIVLDSGERIPVRHPEDVYALKQGREFIVYENGHSWRFEDVAVSAVERPHRR